MASSVDGVSSQSSQTLAPTQTDAYASLDLNEFVKLLVAELQNQDPMNPMDNAQILSQVSQIRQIESNQRLTDTLDSVLLGQNVATASSMIGQSITGLDENSDKITGVVSSVSIAEGKAVLNVGEHQVELTNIAEIVPASST